MGAPAWPRANQHPCTACRAARLGEGEVELGLKGEGEDDGEGEGDGEVELLDRGSATVVGTQPPYWYLRRRRQAEARSPVMVR